MSGTYRNSCRQQRFGVMAGSALSMTVFLQVQMQVFAYTFVLKIRHFAKPETVSGYLWKHPNIVSFCKRLMRFYIPFCFATCLLTGCDISQKPVQQESVESIDFTYNDVFSTCFSIKYSQSDTAYIRQHFTSSFSDNLESETSYLTLLTQADRITLDSFINKIPFHSYDTSYYEDYQDGIDYQFYIQKNNLKKCIRVHSDNVPSALTDFKNWIVKRKEQYALHRVDTTIYFESAKYVVPPPAPPPPPIEFKTPKTKNSR
jgi:hypothetical protein